MTDIVDKQTRSRMMSGIRGKNTKPEMIIRRGLRSAGFGYRLHRPELPGKPDLVLRKYCAIILVHGCFWHGHGCHLFKWPGGDRAGFWRKKITSNIERDKRLLETYEAEAWRVATVWECALKGKYRLDSSDVISQLTRWLESDRRNLEISCGEP